MTIAQQAPAGARTSMPRRSSVRLWLLGVSTLMFGAATVLPIWWMKLLAPQYPGGLRLIIFSDRVEGDLMEVNELNHYIGMRPFEPADVPEMRLWVPTLLALMIVGAGALFASRARTRRIAQVVVWLVPIGVLVDVQSRLFQYGHDLDPKRALRVEEFTPWAIGRTKVWNFTAWSAPNLGYLAVVAGALVVTLGPRLVSHTSHRLAARQAPRALVAAVVAIGLLFAATPAHASDDLATIIARAAPGSIVTVPPGIHHGSLVIDRPITLRSSGGVIHGDTGSTITVRAPGVTIRGLVVRGSGHGPVGGPAGIRVEADHVTIESVTITGAYHGIATEGATDLRIIDVSIVGRGGAIEREGHAMGGGTATDQAPPEPRGDGLYLVGADRTLIRNLAVRDARDGIYLSFGREILIDRTGITNGRYAIHAMFAREVTAAENVFRANRSGAVLMYGGPVLLLRNRFEDHRSPATGFGVLLKDVTGADAVENRFEGNRIGIQIEGPTEGGAMIRANTIAQNAIGIALMPSAHATFTRNTIIDNAVQVMPLARGAAANSAWSNRGLGNLWSNYRGSDRHGDGIGDLPHIEGGTVTNLISRAPLLGALASSPAFRLLRALEERWASIDPALTDELPLVSPVAAAVLPGPASTPIGPLVVTTGTLLAIAAALSLRRLRGAATPTRRVLDVVA